MEIPKQFRLVIGQKVFVQKLIKGPHFQRQHTQSSLNLEMVSWYMDPYTYFLVSLAEDITLQATKGGTWTPTKPQNPSPTICSTCKMFWVHGASKLKE